MLSSRDLNRDALTGFSGGASSNYSGGDGGYGGDAPASQGSWGGPGSAVVGGESVVGEGMFGSLAWTGGGTGRGRRKGANELLGCLGMGSRRASKTKSSSSGVMYNDDGSPRNSRTEMRDRWMHLEGEGEGTGEGLAAECDADQIQRAEGGLVGGLKPFRDRYLAGALGRMTGPVLQMFPEMEGYTGGWMISISETFLRAFKLTSFDESEHSPYSLLYSLSLAAPFSKSSPLSLPLLPSVSPPTYSLDGICLSSHL